MEEALNLFGSKKQAPARPVAAPAPRPSRLIERMEDFFKSNKFCSFTTLEILRQFQEDKPEAIRNQLRKLIREREIKFTGEVNAKRWRHGDQAVDHAYLTATIYKTAGK